MADAPETFSCPECRALYEVTRTTFPEPVEDYAECVEVRLSSSRVEHLFCPALPTGPNPGRAHASREANGLNAATARLRECYGNAPGYGHI
jgi:hypothetical protein